MFRSKEEIDMLHGSMLPKMIQYAIPVILTGVLQMLYGTADSIVMGRFVGKEALAAVGTTKALTNLLINLFLGIGTGAGLVISQYYGAGDIAGVHRSVHTAMPISVISGGVLAVGGVFLSRPILIAMGAPGDVIDLAVLYLQIIFVGMPFNMVTNFGAGILRAVGDTKTPMYILVMTGFMNMVLNMVFVLVFKMGIAGVALATIISQVASAVLIVIVMIRTHSAIHFDIRDMKIHKKELIAIVKMGLPTGIQSCMYSLSNVLLQSSVNSFGSAAMAGTDAAKDVLYFQSMILNGFFQANMTFAAQNYGARQYRRTRRSMWITYGIISVVGIATSVAFLLAGPFLISLYNTDPEVISWGVRYLTLIGSVNFISSLVDTTTGELRAVSYPILSMVACIIGICGFRILWIYTVFAAHHSFEILYLCYPISWVITGSVMLVLYFTVARKKMLRLEKEQAAAE